VAENQPKLFEAVNALAWRGAPVAFEESGKGHGRNETRTTKVLPAPAGLPFPNASQVILTERITTGRPCGKNQAVAALAVTALPAHLAGPADLARHIREFPSWPPPSRVSKDQAQYSLLTESTR
jgi:hypothetical protein